MANEPVYTAGVGLKENSVSAYDGDTRIRHAYLQIASTRFCEAILRHDADVRSIICVYSQLQQTPYHGDSGMCLNILIVIIQMFKHKCNLSGGPLIRQSDKL